jgi:hypothetical protein
MMARSGSCVGGGCRYAQEHKRKVPPGTKKKFAARAQALEQLQPDQGTLWFSFLALPEQRGVQPELGSDGHKNLNNETNKKE